LVRLDDLLLGISFQIIFKEKLLKCVESRNGYVWWSAIKESFCIELVMHCDALFLDIPKRKV